jgi:hypothetical protein
LSERPVGGLGPRWVRDGLGVGVLEPVGELLELVGEQVPVAVQGHRGRGVAQLGLDRLDADALGDMQAGACVAKVMEPQIGGHHLAIGAQLTRALRRARNRPGGYWVAAADPEAARQAVTGTLPAKSLRRAVLLSDGASRLVDPFGLATWEELLALLEESGPDELLRQVRAAEAVDPEGRQWPRTKRSDDATAVYLALDEAANPQP